MSRLRSNVRHKRIVLVADLKDLLLAKYQEERNYARQHENQRATVTTVIIAIAAATIGFLGTSKGSQFHTLAALFLIGLGVFGAILSRKHYERFRFHSLWAKEFDRKLRESEPTLDIEEYDPKLDKHYKMFPWIGRARLNWLWIGIHLLITVIGIALLVFFPGS